MVFRSFFIVMMLLLGSQTACASDKALHDSPISAIGYFQEEGLSPLALPQVTQRFNQGQFTHAKRQFLTFGINHHATWVRLSLYNPSQQHIRKRLVAAQTWVESVDVYLVQQQLLQQWHTGDAQPADKHLVPTVGYAFDMDIPPGNSEIFIRGQSLDPLTMPIELMDVDQSRSEWMKIHVAIGVVYGILLVLVGFNILLYATLKHSVALYYALYIGCFIIMNFGYEGFGFSWLYPNSPQFQNYSTLFFMVLHGASGLVFVSHYLQISAKKSPLRRLLQIYIIAGILGGAISVALQLHILMAWIAFSFISLTTLIMIAVALLNFTRSIDARYLLLAVSCSMFGLLASALSVWGIIPYSFYGFHGAEFGVVCEAVILAVVVAFRLRNIEQERITAQYMATHDPLTRLNNRRAFEINATSYLQQTENLNKSVSFIMMDIDYFKAINDSYGHHVGDQALYHIANLLSRLHRKGDIVARWGGEEMAMLLPNTELAQAYSYAEQLRQALQDSPLLSEELHINITASFGVSSCINHGQHDTLSDLYKTADKWLYYAKNQGRNRVEPAHD
ncbi:hypothetical protein HR45_05760 [Shewanella mangrovi]|uniref:diguanylate cyclase n=1 Tax=Shewanella mangrovi TaxID=1515746 RepID=A0A094JFK9_9GAMM|nr:diguanylate cyclase [Shewanella mangrovi]KFZ38017.1 hypothetical protein HR45_05760 [Shewanella mangrovi]